MHLSKILENLQTHIKINLLFHLHNIYYQTCWQKRCCIQYMKAGRHIQFPGNRFEGPQPIHERVYSHWLSCRKWTRYTCPGTTLCKTSDKFEHLLLLQFPNEKMRRFMWKTFKNLLLRYYFEFSMKQVFY